MRSAKVLVLVLVTLLVACDHSRQQTGFAHTQGPYRVEVLYPKWVRGPHLPVDVTMSNMGGDAVGGGLPEPNSSCGLIAVPLRRVQDGERLQPVPEPKLTGCNTEARVLQLETGQSLQYRYWYSVRGVPAGEYTLPLKLPAEFGLPVIEVQVRR